MFASPPQRPIVFKTGLGLTLAACLAVLTLGGCERKERVLDVETADGSLQVDRNVDTGEVDVKVQDND